MKTLQILPTTFALCTSPDKPIWYLHLAPGLRRMHLILFVRGNLMATGKRGSLFDKIELCRGKKYSTASITLDEWDSILELVEDWGGSPFWVKSVASLDHPRVERFKTTTEEGLVGSPPFAESPLTGLLNCILHDLTRNVHVDVGPLLNGEFEINHDSLLDVALGLFRESKSGLKLDDGPLESILHILSLARPCLKGQAIFEIYKRLLDSASPFGRFQLSLFMSTLEFPIEIFEKLELPFKKDGHHFMALLQGYRGTPPTREYVDHLLVNHLYPPVKKSHLWSFWKHVSETFEISNEDRKLIMDHVHALGYMTEEYERRYYNHVGWPTDFSSFPIHGCTGSTMVWFDIEERLEEIRDLAKFNPDQAWAECLLLFKYDPGPFYPVTDKFAETILSLFKSWPSPNRRLDLVLNLIHHLNDSLFRICINQLNEYQDYPQYHQLVLSAVYRYNGAEWIVWPHYLNSTTTQDQRLHLKELIHLCFENPNNGKAIKSTIVKKKLEKCHDWNSFIGTLDLLKLYGHLERGCMDHENLLLSKLDPKDKYRAFCLLLEEGIFTSPSSALRFLISFQAIDQEALLELQKFHLVSLYTALLFTFESPDVNHAFHLVKSIDLVQDINGTISGDLASQVQSRLSVHDALSLHQQCAKFNVLYDWKGYMDHLALVAPSDPLAVYEYLLKAKDEEIPIGDTAQNAILSSLIKAGHVKETVQILEMYECKCDGNVQDILLDLVKVTNSLEPLASLSVQIDSSIVHFLMDQQLSSSQFEKAMSPYQIIVNRKEESSELLFKIGMALEWSAFEDVQRQVFEACIRLSSQQAIPTALVDKMYTKLSSDKVQRLFQVLSYNCHPSAATLRWYLSRLERNDLITAVFHIRHTSLPFDLVEVATFHIVRFNRLMRKLSIRVYENLKLSQWNTARNLQAMYGHTKDTYWIKSIYDGITMFQNEYPTSPVIWKAVDFTGRPLPPAIQRVYLNAVMTLPLEKKLVLVHRLSKRKDLDATLLTRLIEYGSETKDLMLIESLFRNAPEDAFGSFLKVYAELGSVDRLYHIAPKCGLKSMDVPFLKHLMTAALVQQNSSLYEQALKCLPIGAKVEPYQTFDAFGYDLNKGLVLLNEQLASDIPNRSIVFHHSLQVIPRMIRVKRFKEAQGLFVKVASAGLINPSIVWAILKSLNKANPLEARDFYTLVHSKWAPFWNQPWHFSEFFRDLGKNSTSQEPLDFWYTLLVPKMLNDCDMEDKETIFNAILFAYGSAGRDRAKKQDIIDSSLDRMKCMGVNPGPETYGSLISGLSFHHDEHGFGSGGLECLDKLVGELEKIDMTIPGESFVDLMKGFSYLERQDKVRQCWEALMTKLAHPDAMIVFSSLNLDRAFSIFLDSVGRHGTLSELEAGWKQILERGTVSDNVICSYTEALCRFNQFDTAIESVFGGRDGPDLYTQLTESPPSMKALLTLAGGLRRSPDHFNRVNPRILEMAKSTKQSKPQSRQQFVSIQKLA